MEIATKIYRDEFASQYHDEIIKEGQLSPLEKIRLTMRTYPYLLDRGTDVSFFVSIISDEGSIIEQMRAPNLASAIMLWNTEVDNAEI